MACAAPPSPLPVASLSARRSTATAAAACYPTSSRRSRRSWFPSGNAPRARLRAEAKPVEERLAAAPAPSAPSEPLPQPRTSTWNWKGYNIRYQYAGTSGPALVLIHGFGANRQFSSTGFAAALKPNIFDGANYKRWRARAVLWLTAMNCFHVTKGKPEGTLSSQQEEAFEVADNLFRGAVLSVLGDNIVDYYMTIFSGKDMWAALEAKFGVSDAGSELYVMEQYHDYRMVDDRSVVEQAHEIQSLAKELEHFKCVLPDKFIAGGIIAKLPPSWRNFATSLKHKRQEFSVADLIGTLDVEEKARAKDTRARVTEGNSNANVVQKRNFQSHKFKNKNKFEGKNKPLQSTNFKKKKTDKGKGGCFVCGDPSHWAKNCKERKDKQQHGQNSNTANVVIGDTEMRTSGSHGIPPC